MICGLLLIAAAIAALNPAAQGRQRADRATAAERFWPQWRGPYATGVSKYADPPLEWSETKNVRWKVEIPGRGSASSSVLHCLVARSRYADGFWCLEPHPGNQ